MSVPLALKGVTMSQKPETRFRNSKVLPFLKTLKNTAYFAVQQTSIRGDADYILCSKGRFVWLELKADGEKPRPLQEYKADWVVKCDGVAMVAFPANWAGMKKILAKLDQGEDP